jgi:hypothetical protein
MHSSLIFFQSPEKGDNSWLNNSVGDKPFSGLSRISANL